MVALGQTLLDTLADSCHGIRLTIQQTTPPTAKQLDKAALPQMLQCAQCMLLSAQHASNTVFLFKLSDVQAQLFHKALHIVAQGAVTSLAGVPGSTEGSP